MNLPVEVPTSLYIVVGLLVVGNFGVIISLLTLIFKAGMFVSMTKAGITDAKETAVRAHKRLDKFEEEIE